MKLIKIWSSLDKGCIELSNGYIALFVAKQGKHAWKKNALCYLHNESNLELNQAENRHPKETFVVPKKHTVNWML